MTLDQALYLLGLLADTVSAQRARIDVLEAQLAAATAPPSGDG